MEKDYISQLQWTFVNFQIIVQTHTQLLPYHRTLTCHLVFVWILQLLELSSCSLFS